MEKRKHHELTIKRVQLVRELTERYYEAGNNQRCYKAVWRRYINPIYPMCYRTYLNYLNMPTPPPPPPTPLQLSLFEFFDESPRR